MCVRGFHTARNENFAITLRSVPSRPHLAPSQARPFQVRNRPSWQNRHSLDYERRVKKRNGFLRRRGRGLVDSASVLSAKTHEPLLLIVGNRGFHFDENGGRAALEAHAIQEVDRGIGEGRGRSRSRLQLRHCLSLSLSLSLPADHGPRGAHRRRERELCRPSQAAKLLVQPQNKAQSAGRAAQGHDNGLDDDQELLDGLQLGELPSDVEESWMEGLISVWTEAEAVQSGRGWREGDV